MHHDQDLARGAPAGRLSAAEFQHADGVEDWRVVGTGASAWFDSPSHAAGAALVAQIVRLTGDNDLPDVDLRGSGVRVRLGTPDSADLATADLALARAISVAARDVGLIPDPSALQMLKLEIDATDQPSVMSFWQTALDYEPLGDHGLGDPWRRNPSISFHDQDGPRPLRNRIHVDAVRTPDAVTAVKAALGQDAFGAFGLTLADAEGNEVDVVPGDHLGDGSDTADWRTLFGAMACYPTASPAEASALATAAADLADDAGVPLLIDVRPHGVTVDSGKDLWELAEGGASPKFVGLAARIQAAAHDLGLSADPTRVRFLQFGIDAVDVAALREFWRALLGYEHDPRVHLTDIIDPRQLNPVLFFQPMDASEADRRAQRNRIHFDLAVPHDQAAARIDTAVAAGGRVLDRSPGRCAIADPEGNEVAIVTNA